MKVLVYGGGAVGSILGWRIAQQAEAQVSVVCRSNWQRVHGAGYYLRTHTWGTGHFKPHQVFRADSAIRLPLGHRFDYIICANKNTDEPSSILRNLAAIVHPDTTLVSAQNGMDVELPLRRAFPRNTILSAICNIGCSQVSPGSIEQTTRINRPAFLVGIYGTEHDQAQVDGCRRDVLVSMDSQFASVDCADRERWRKLIFNSAVNSTTALTGLNARQLLQQPGAEQLIAKLAGEAYNVGIATGVKLEADIASKTVDLVRSAGDLVPSTLQDVRSRRPLELSPIFGYLVSQATKVGTPIPTMTWIYSLLRQKNEEFMVEKSSRNRQPSLNHSHLIDRLLSGMIRSEISV